MAKERMLEKEGGLTSCSASPDPNQDSMGKNLAFMGGELKTVVERLLDCAASFLEDVVVEKTGEDTIWNGKVSVFEIEGRPEATRAYVWSSPIEGSRKRQCRAVLNIPAVNSPEEAVRASIVPEKLK